MPICIDTDALLHAVKGRPLAVVTTPAGWAPGLGAISDWLLEHADVRGYVALEHGLRGDLQDGVRFDSYVDERSGCPVYSMYGGGGRFPEELLAQVETVVFHVQDVSHRAYTFKLALAETLEAAAGTQIRVLVVDRPTPLAHLGSRGPLWKQFFPRELPVVIGTTLGELALWLARKQRLDVDVGVLPVGDWRRTMLWSDTGLPWIPPSPNVPSLASAYCYACTGVLQPTTVSEGRGTCKPFEYFGAPFVDAGGLVAALNGRGLPGVAFREAYFTPAFNKYAGELCAGAHLMILEPRRVEPLKTMLAVLQELIRHGSAEFELTKGFSNWMDGEPWDVTKLSGLDTDVYLGGAAAQSRAFMDDIDDCLLY